MKNLLLLLFVFSALRTTAQTDTVVVDGKPITGTITDNYTDRLLIKDATGTNWLVMKDRITALSVKRPVVYNGQQTYEYATDIKRLQSSALFKDQKHYLREAGTLGIIASSFIIAGAATAAIGTAAKSNGVQIAGSAVTTAGFINLIPAFVQLIKAGKTKAYKVP